LLVVSQASTSFCCCVRSGLVKMMSLRARLSGLYGLPQYACRNENAFPLLARSLAVMVTVVSPTRLVTAVATGCPVVTSANDRDSIGSDGL
jgi:hypothetical protein